MTARSLTLVAILGACVGTAPPTKPNYSAPRLLHRFARAKKLRQLTLHLYVCVTGEGTFGSVKLLPPDEWPELEQEYADQFRHARWPTPDGVPPGKPFCTNKVVNYVFSG